MLIYDLLLSTRRELPTGIERFAINAFKASVAAGSGAVAIVRRGTNLGPGLDVIEVDGGLVNWLSLGQKVRQHFGQGPHTVICSSFPPSPSMMMGGFKVVRVLHDAFPWTRTAALPWRGRLLFKEYEQRLLSRYDRVFVPTSIVQQEVTAALRPRRPIPVCGNAPGLSPDGASQPIDALLGKPFLLCVGSVEPRKNYEAILSLASSGQFPDHTIVIAGRPGWGDIVAQIEAAEARPDARIVWLRNASDENLRWLYGNCAAFLSLSHAEGFNMPLVEAGTFGCRIVASDIPIHREVSPTQTVFVEAGAPVQPLVQSLTTALEAPPPDDVSHYRSRYSWTSVAHALEAGHRSEHASGKAHETL